MIRTGLILVTVGCLLSAALSQTQPTTAPTTAAASKPAKEYRQTYREGFQPPADASAEMKRMRELIDKINRTSLPEYRPEPAAKQTPRVAKDTKPAETKPAKKPQETTPEGLSAQTLKNLAQRVPESVADPIRLGDALYRSGHATEALFIYEQALKDAKEEDDQLWLYYQMGSCLKNDKPAEARKYFKKIHTIAPDSPWAELADVQLQLVDWMERNQPKQFLEDLQRDLHPQDERTEKTKQAQSRTGTGNHQAGSGSLGTTTAVVPSTPGIRETNNAAKAMNAQ